MAANGTTSEARRSARARRVRRRPRTSRTDAQKIREGLTKVRNGSVSYARQTAERTVDVPVGVVLTVADRVNEVVEPFTKRETAERELKSFRTQVERELNKLERRGATVPAQGPHPRAPDPEQGPAPAQAAPAPVRDHGQAEPRPGREGPEAGADHGSGAGLDARLAPLARAA